MAPPTPAPTPLMMSGGARDAGMLLFLYFFPVNPYLQVGYKNDDTTTTSCCNIAAMTIIKTQHQPALAAGTVTCLSETAMSEPPRLVSPGEIWTRPGKG